MDWIKARLECSLEHALLVLRERVKADVEQWRRQVAPDSKINLTFDGPRTLLSIPKFQDLGPWVTFEAKDNSILVRRGNSRWVDEREVQQAKLLPTVNPRGECRLRLNAEELEFWQASRFILEDLLFG